jgi:sulfur carrier protein ThiS
MKKISLRLYASLRKYTDGVGAMDLEIEPGATIEQVLRRQGVPPDQVRIIFVNGRAAGLNDALHGDEQLELFSAIGGG